MKMPCLECSDLNVDETHIIIFDKFIKKIYKSRKLHQKEKLEGLVNRANAILERLLKFYQVKFEFSKEVVDI